MPRGTGRGKGRKSRFMRRKKVDKKRGTKFRSMRTENIDGLQIFEHTRKPVIYNRNVILEEEEEDGR